MWAPPLALCAYCVPARGPLLGGEPQFGAWARPQLIPAQCPGTFRRLGGVGWVGFMLPPLFLLPGNHDPLTPRSIWDADHSFRRALPDYVEVVDRDDFV